MVGGLTIGQAAAFCGVTIKTVRHYHRVGLVEEPRRDTSGYRRYTSTELLRLVQVRTLAEAGVALAEIDDILGTDTVVSAAALSGIERRLDEQIAELIGRRERLRRLGDGDRALLSDRACLLLERHAEVGFPPDFVAEQRDGMILAKSLGPEFFDGYLTLLDRRLADPVYVELQKRGWTAASWRPDDPRLDDLAGAIADNLLKDRELMEAQGAAFVTRDAGVRYRVISNHRADELPTVARLNELIEARLRAAGLTMPTQ
ncbi:MerR family transcriptional regulator [Pseudonocardia sp. McavD-2-B]|uniref:MerR family transcriptional regulator n=1 Tax=Pseudonocardia sp. McavD-2-B TaxID=2954499 RepID=UPI002097732B|nr:MerR family transcriptional regulator [Pseudonocardia sp. McavD-2-B]MCO7193062.1 MerR family transcriptional regulator [Pseudonocardia sp. McavD-2-B]